MASGEGEGEGDEVERDNESLEIDERVRLTSNKALDDHNSSTSGSKGGRLGGGEGDTMDDELEGRGGIGTPFGLFIVGGGSCSIELVQLITINRFMKVGWVSWRREIS